MENSFFTAGNVSLWDRSKIAFFCSRNFPPTLPASLLKWINGQGFSDECLMSAYHSEIEKNVVQEILQRNQPIIIVLARGLPARPPQEILQALAREQLLLMTPFPPEVKRINSQTALKRNRFMAQFADKILVAHAQPGGTLEELIMEWKATGKSVHTLPLPENHHLLEKGILPWD